MNIEDEIDEIRNDFFNLDTNIYMNTAGIGPPSKITYNAAQDWWRQRGEYRNQDSPIDAFEEATKLLHCSKDEVCMITRPLDGLNTLKDVIDWEKGDNIVVTDLSYPSSVHTFLPLRKMGVTINRIENHEGMVDASDWDDHVDDRTKLVVVNRTECFSGLTYDVEEISKIGHQHDSLVVDDDFQAFGVVPIDVRKSGLDFFITGSFKWQCGPVGAGLFYVKEKLIDRFEPKYESYTHVIREGEAEIADYRYVSEPDHDNLRSYELPYVKSAQKFNRGQAYQKNKQINWEWAAALRHINDLTERYGADSINERVTSLGGYLIEALKDMRCVVYTPENPKKRHGLIVYSSGSRGRDKTIYEKFIKNDPPIHTSIRYGGGFGGIRVSLHYFNTYEEIDQLVKIQGKNM